MKKSTIVIILVASMAMITLVVVSDMPTMDTLSTPTIALAYAVANVEATDEVIIEAKPEDAMPTRKGFARTVFHPPS